MDRQTRENKKASHDFTTRSYHGTSRTIEISRDLVRYDPKRSVVTWAGCRARRATISFLTPVTFSLLLFVAGCAQTASREELFEIAIHSQGIGNPAIMYYKGSNAIYDYYDLRHRAGAAGDGLYRVPRDHSRNLPRFALTEDRSKWVRVYPPVLHRATLRSPDVVDPQRVPQGQTEP